MVFLVVSVVVKRGVVFFFEFVALFFRVRFCALIISRGVLQCIETDYKTGFHYLLCLFNLIPSTICEICANVLYNCCAFFSKRIVIG